MDKVISVVIPTYNRKRLTDRAVESVKSRRPELIEIVVVDDCGTESYSYGSQLNSNGIFVRVIRDSTNGGAGHARKAGVNVASGELIAFLDSDDEFGCAWLDALIYEHSSRDACVRGSAIYVGRVAGWKFSHSMVWHLIKKMPLGLRLWTGRIITIAFNPFYTPSIAISKSICQFKEQLRFCEDYYTMSKAIFTAKRLITIDELACGLGRNPNSSGGISGVRIKMFTGEMLVRFEMLKADYVPLLYKIFVPFGMVYQLLRSFVKLFSVKG